MILQLQQPADAILSVLGQVLDRGENGVPAGHLADATAGGLG
ncbi:MAG TPA: hypothetical protein VE617_14150 [Propionibacteriaceae bacterium]|nr:hypothetical protein [Propionibacteriaceae bacterium]